MSLSITFERAHKFANCFFHIIIISLCSRDVIASELKAFREDTEIEPNRPSNQSYEKEEK